MRRAALVAACVAAAALLGAGYASDGLAGLADMTALAAIAALLLVRGTVRREKPPDVMRKEEEPMRGGAFPGFSRLVSDLEWAVLSRRHYQHAVRPALVRLAATLRRPPPPPCQEQADGPGPDPAELARIISRLEEP